MAVSKTRAKLVDVARQLFALTQSFVTLFFFSITLLHAFNGSIIQYLYMTTVNALLQILRTISFTLHIKIGYIEIKYCA